MKDLSKPTTLVLILLTLILGGIAALYAVANKIVQDNQQIQVTKSDIQGQYLLRDRYEELFDQYLEVTKDDLLDAIKTVIPSGDNFILVIEELEAIANLSQNSILVRLGDTRLTSDGFEIDTRSVRNQSSTGITTNSSNYDFIEIEASLRGDYAAMEQFFNLFNQSKYFMNITSITINRVVSGGVAVLDTHLTIQVFVEKVIVISE